ncbi:DUF4221 family protein [Chitinophaga sp. S165]|uniref:DUF4221 family protein n=1 Tax=Chitinophaga sp. S165 TaxID=2135462 RepID=UPI000D71685A|nr:DUF4221 family protein [Chitinophaga sp. S165]PWV49085.1 uncharacterized protein DUF4221 [Chitinophaga sp. S165]
MKSRMLSLLWLITITLYGCETPAEKTWSNCSVSGKAVIPLAISYNDTLNLHLDEMMVLGWASSVDYQAKEKMLYVFDRYNKRLLSYNLNAKGLIYPDSIYPIKISSSISYIKYISRDTVALYTYGGASGATLFYYSLNRDTVYKSLAFVKEEVVRMKISAAPPYPSAGKPLFFTDNRVIGAGMMLGEGEGENVMTRTICTKIDLPSGNISNHIPYPKLYWQYNWGGSHMRDPYTSFNERTKKMILSLPADHNIQVIDSNWQTTEFYAGSRRDICITSMPLSKDDKKLLDEEATLGYFTGTPSYRNIIYDKYHDRYYRILEMPPVPLQSYTGTYLDKNISIIAFDKDFNYLGEARLPDYLGLDNFFVTSEGLYFLNVGNKNKDLAQYVQCKIEL